MNHSPNRANRSVDACHMSGSNGRREIRLCPHQHGRSNFLQLAALKRARCSGIFEYKGLSGGSVKRPALSRCLKTLRAGDTLIVWKLDRLGRSLRDLITMLDDLRSE